MTESCRPFLQFSFSMPHIHTMRMTYVVAALAAASVPKKSSCYKPGLTPILYNFSNPLGWGWNSLEIIAFDVESGHFGSAVILQMTNFSALKRSNMAFKLLLAQRSKSCHSIQLVHGLPSTNISWLHTGLFGKRHATLQKFMVFGLEVCHSQFNPFMDQHLIFFSKNKEFCIKWL